MFNIDWTELDDIMEQWHLRRKSVRKLSDIALDTDYLIWQQPNREKIYDLKCSICLGLLRLPSVACAACHNNFCKQCADKAREAFDAMQAENSSDDPTMFGLPRPKMECPLCKEVLVEAPIDLET